jgi:(R,R)-butanediol dehydrogenase/meso-butanediol dehydrogenase/diacetyl reductase
VAPDVIVECVGLPLLQHLVETAPREAHIVSVGAAMVPDAIAPHVAAAKKLRVSFSFGYQLSDFEYIIRMIDSGRLATDGLVTRSVSLDEAPDAFDELLAPNSHCKVMIQPA